MSRKAEWTRYLWVAALMAVALVVAGPLIAEAIRGLDLAWNFGIRLPKQ